MLSYPAPSRIILSYPTQSCRTLPYPALSGLILYPHVPSKPTLKHISRKVPPRSRGRDEPPSIGRDHVAIGAGNADSNGNATGGILGGGGGNNSGRRLFGLAGGGVGGEVGGVGVGGGGGGAPNAGFDSNSLKRGIQQGGGGGGQGSSISSSGDRCGVGSSPPMASARYPPLEQIQNPPQPDPKVRADASQYKIRSLGSYGKKSCWRFVGVAAERKQAFLLRSFRSRETHHGGVRPRGACFYIYLLRVVRSGRHIEQTYKQAALVRCATIRRSSTSLKQGNILV